MQNGVKKEVRNGNVMTSAQVYQQPDKAMESSYTAPDTMRTRAFVNQEKDKSL